MRYKFKCKNEHITERDFSIKDKPEEVKCCKMSCPEMARTLHEGGALLIFKGNGWGAQ